ncbi:MAG: EAL domain-containing protein [Candidatus Nanopelagicales bacterium]
MGASLPEGDSTERARTDLWVRVLDDIVSEHADLDRTLALVARRVGEGFDAATGIFFVGPDGALRLRAAWDADPARIADVRAMLESFPASAELGAMATVVRERRPVLVDGDAVSVRAPYQEFTAEHQMVGTVLIPLLGDEDDVIGVLAVGRFGAGRRPFDSVETEELDGLALVAAQLVRLVLLVDRRRMADVALAGMTEAVVAIDASGVVTFWNSGAEHLYGHPASEVLGRHAESILAGTQVGAPGDPLDPRVVADSLGGSGTWVGRISHRRSDGSPIWVDSVVTTLIDSEGRPGVVVVNRDVTGEIQADAEVRRQQALAQAALDSSPMGVGVFDETGIVIASSRVWDERLGPECGMGASGSSVMARFGTDDETRDRLLRSFEAVVSGDQPRANADCDVETKNGRRTFSIHMAAVAGIGATVSIADVTDRAARERELSYSATHDRITRLPNRSFLLDRATHALNRASRQRGRVGLLFCDLDGFKVLNDRFGHGTGDDVLELFARRLVESCRGTDTVARIGGDEFAILIEDSVDDATVGQIAARVTTMAEVPLSVPAGDLPVTASVGAVVVQPDPDRLYVESDVTAFLDQADAAMYEAKRLGKNRWVMFDQALRQRQENRGVLVGDLVRGTRSGEFRLQFQPQFDPTGRVGGAASLLRWEHPEHGMVEPLGLLAEEGNLPLAVGDWLLGQVAATVQAWEPSLPEGFRAGVALSRSQWLDRHTADVLLDWLSRTGVRPERLRVVIGQDSLAADLDHSAATTQRLLDSGVDVAVGEFGTGSLSLLDIARLRVSSVILSRRVVRDLGRVPGAESLLHAMVTMHRRMGWRTVVTGVESADQLERVRDVHPALVQGFLLGPPVPADEFASRWL